MEGNCHSWAACTQYEATISGQDYSDAACIGYPRDWGNEYGPRSSSFGVDVGADYQPGGRTASGTWCDRTLDTTNSDYSGSYTSDYPMASYVFGDTIRIVWPAKNHANYECFGNVPDFAMKLYYNANVNPSSDPQTLSDWTLVHDWHDGFIGGTDGVPFQNCPSFCDNTDRAVCYGDVTLDDTSLFTQGDGVYTFMWYWAFNSDDDIYTTCWEAKVDTTTTATGTDTTDTDTSNTDTSNTDTSNTDTSNTDDTTDDSSNTNNNNIDEKTYLIFIPICIEGVSYDSSIILTSASNLFANVEWYIHSIFNDASNNEFNVTINTYADSSTVVQSITSAASNNDHAFCEEITTLYDEMVTDGTSVTSCDSCQDVLVYRTTVDSDNSESNSSDSDSDESDSTTIIIICVVIGIVLLLLIVGGVYYKFYYSKYTRKSNHYGTQDYGHKKTPSIKNILQTNTQNSQAISYVNDEKDAKPNIR